MSREETLATFQACTGIEDVAEAILHLEEAEWDLLRAIGRIMPPDSQSFQAQRTDDPDVTIVDTEEPKPMSAKLDRDCTIVSVYSNRHMGDLEQPSTSSYNNHKFRKIKFTVQFKEQIASFEMHDTDTVGTLKLRIQNELKIPPCKQVLYGWAKQIYQENVPFNKFLSNSENSICLTVKNMDEEYGSDIAPEITERLSSSYILNIQFGDTNYKLNYLGSTPVLEVKTGLYALTSIEVRNQVWIGWPSTVTDQTLLAMSGIEFPEHNFTLSAAQNRTITNNIDENSEIHVIESDDEFEDASETFTVDDDFFMEDVSQTRTEPLLPDNVEDDIVGSLMFSERFTARYGPAHPTFFQGSLDEAIQEACNKPAKSKKILAIYIHHDSSVLTNVFCTQLLGFESVLQIFENNFLLWGWDVTFESNALKLQTLVTNRLGALAAMNFRNTPVERLPALVLIMRIRSATEIFNVVHGNVGVNEFLSSLIEATEVFSEHQRLEAKEEQERTERELVKWEQDQAYRESLEADQAKEEARLHKAREEDEARRKLENEQAEEMAKKNAHRVRVEASLPQEPAAEYEDKDGIIKVRFRLPKGEFLERRFLANTSLKVLLDFLMVKGYPQEDYKAISSWPRRDLTILDQTKTLKDLNLFSQETVILEER